MKKRLLSLLLAAACLMPLSGCDWGEEPEETYDTLSQYYQQSDSTKQDTRLTSFGLPYLQGETWDPITCADGAQQTLGALLYESLYTLGTDFLPQPCLAESASYDAESYALTVTVRSGVTFSDGSALTAWDVVAALRRAENPFITGGEGGPVCRSAVKTAKRAFQRELKSACLLPVFMCLARGSQPAFCRISAAC